MSGFLCVQRFSLYSINAFICLFPYGLFIYYLVVGKTVASLSCLLIALICSVDNGGEVYAETPAGMRYAIYLSVIFMMLRLGRWTLKRQALIFGGLMLTGILIGSIANFYLGNAFFNADIFRRDIQILAILGILALGRRKGEFDLSLVFAGSFGYLSGELANAIFFYTAGNDYMSYDSLKVFVIFPLIYVMMTNRPSLVQIGLTLTTVSIVILYGTRMIVVSALLIFLAGLLINTVRAKSFKIYNWIAILCLALILFDIGNFEYELLDGFKAFSFLSVAIRSFHFLDIFEVFQILDPVRFSEHQIFFDRSWLEVAFGSGIGSGILDTKGVLGFVTSDQTAFPTREISTSTYFHFHSYWIDFGLRFGLLPTIYFIYRLTISEMLQGRLWLGVLFGMLLLNTTFATSGVLLTAFVYRFFPVAMGSQYTTSPLSIRAKNE